MENFEKQQNNNPEIQEAPDGWKTNNAISKELPTSPYIIQKIADKYREANPEYFKKFKVNGRALREHFSPELIKIIIEEIKKIPEPPSGWKIVGEILNEFDINIKIVKSIADEYVNTNPEYFKTFKSKTGEPRLYYSPEFLHILKDRLDKNQKAPDGWKTIGSIAVEHKATYAVLSKIADKYEGTHPEYLGNFKDRNGQRVLRYCSPELIKIIEEEFNTFKNMPEPPLGWETNGTVFKDLQTGTEQVSRIADMYRESNPEYFGEFRHKNVGRIDEYYSPELIDIIKQKIKESQSIPETPEGWKTVTGLAEGLDVAFKTIEKIADEYRETNPEYFKNFKVKEGKVRGPIREHYAPELVDIITKQILENKNIPEALPGWKTLSILYKELNSYSKMIKVLTDVYRNDHPEYFKNFRSDNGKIYEYYSPELVILVTQDLKKSEVPLGWENLANLTKKLDVGSSIMRAIINKYRDNKEYFGEFRAPIAGVGQYYSPELVGIIEKEVKILKEIPEPLPGWETNHFIAKKVGTDYITVRRFIKPFETNNPEYFKKFRTKVGLLTHYSPVLVKLIEEHFQQKNAKDAPENWLSIDKMSENTGISKEEIDKMAKKLRQKFPGKFGKFKSKDNQ